MQPRTSLQQCRKTPKPLGKGADVFIAVWNLHRSPHLWEKPDVFDPKRFERAFSNPAFGETWAGYNPKGAQNLLYPNETVADFAFIPFGGGARKCVGDQFALMEATVVLAMLLQRFRWASFQHLAFLRLAKRIRKYPASCKL